MTAKARERERESEDISFSPSFFFSFSRTPVKRLVELLSPTVTLEAACISPPTARPFNSGRVGRWWKRERNGRDRKGGTYKELLLTNWQPHGTTNRKQRLADGSIFQAIPLFSLPYLLFSFPLAVNDCNVASEMPHVRRGPGGAYGPRRTRAAI